jgi:hypothetical protein
MHHRAELIPAKSRQGGSGLVMAMIWESQLQLRSFQVVRIPNCAICTVDQNPNSPAGLNWKPSSPDTVQTGGAKTVVITPIDAPEAFTVGAAADRQRKNAEQHSPVVLAFGLVYCWQSLIDAGKFDSISAIAAAEDLSKAHVSRLMQLLRLSPARVREVLKALQSNRLDRNTRHEIPNCLDREREGVDKMLVL